MSMRDVLKCSWVDLGGLSVMTCGPMRMRWWSVGSWVIAPWEQKPQPMHTLERVWNGLHNTPSLLHNHTVFVSHSTLDGTTINEQ